VDLNTFLVTWTQIILWLITRSQVYKLALILL